MGRPLRVKKAVEPKRLDKKKRRNEEKAQKRSEQKIEIAQRKKDEDEDDDEIEKLRNFEKSAYGGIDQRSKQIKKEKSMITHINKLQSKARDDDHGEIDITPRLGFNKKKQ